MNDYDIAIEKCILTTAKCGQELTGIPSLVHPILMTTLDGHCRFVCVSDHSLFFQVLIFFKTMVMRQQVLPESENLYVSFCNIVWKERLPPKE